SRPGCGKPSIHLVETPARANRGERGMQRVLCGRRVVHVTRCDNAQSPLSGEGREPVVVGAVERVAVVEELDDDVVVAKEFHEPVDLCPGVAVLESLAHCRLAATREYEPVAVGLPSEILEIIEGPPFLLAPQLRCREGQSQA